MIKLRALALLAFSGSCAATPHAVATSSSAPAVVTPAPAPELLALVENFRQGIIARDANGLAALFINGDVPFVASRWRPEGAKAFPSTAAGFIKDITTDPHKLEERFSDVQAMTYDNGVGIVNARYEFVEDGKVTNHGQEVWSVVHTADGWKIVSVIWSVIIP